MRRQVVSGTGRFCPFAAKETKGIGRHRRYAVIRCAHDELGVRTDRAELADDELVAEFRTVVENVFAVKLRGILVVFVIGVFAHFNVGRCNNILDKTDGRIVNWKNIKGIRQIRIVRPHDAEGAH